MPDETSEYGIANSFQKVDGKGMTHDPIAFDLTEADQRALSVSFGVDPEKVPMHLTGGQLAANNSGVTFLEMIGGHRIALVFAGHPMLARAASAALVQVSEAA